MSKEFLSKLLNKINIDLLGQFDRNEMEEKSFIPVLVRDSYVYVVVSHETDKDAVLDIFAKKNSEYNVQFISDSSSEFNSFLAEVNSKFPVNGADSENNNDKQEKPSEDKTKEESDTPVAQEENQEKNNNSSSAQTVDSNPVDDNSVDDNPSGIKPGEIEKVKNPEKKRIGEILVEERLLTEEQVQEALVKSKQMGYPLGSTLVKLGYITIKQLRDALAAQMNLSATSEEQLSILPDTIPCLSDDFVKSKKVIPLSYSSKSLSVGMVNPKDKDTINQIIGMTGLKPLIFVITAIDYERYLEQYYKKQDASSAAPKVFKKEKTALEMLTEDLTASGDSAGGEQTLWQKVQSDIEDISSDAAKYANMIVTQAIDSRASDIHIEPRLDGYVTRYRIDGTLIEVVRIPSHLESQIISRYKVLAKMNIAEHRRPQDGNFTIKYNNQSYDFRINSLPVNGKEKIVIRILAPSMRAEESYMENIQIAGAFPDDLEKIKFLISAPNGIVLTSGPTGSGKTTTLYALLKTMNSPDVNITTIEDPVEIRLDGVNQSAVNPKAGITFASCMRAILRQDPDVILVGEIRDYETLETAISASLTGHFVLSTVHTNSSAATITRLMEMGAKDYLVSSTLNGVLAQRLVKKLCPHCKKEYYPTEDEVRQITLDPKRIKEIMQKPLYKAFGCDECQGNGYKGRLAILEILVMTKEIKKLIAAHAHDIEIEETAVKNGMRTLRESCIKHILEGNTTISEFVRVLGLVGE